MIVSDVVIAAVLQYVIGPAILVIIPIVTQRMRSKTVDNKFEEVSRAIDVVHGVVNSNTAAMQAHIDNQSEQIGKELDKAHAK